MTEQKQFNDYANFVVSTTSEESLRTEVMIDRLYGLSHTHKDTEFSQLLTAAIGMQAESGEFSEVIKKIISCTLCETLQIHDNIKTVI